MTGISLPEWLIRHADGTSVTDHTGATITEYQYHHFLAERLYELSKNGILLENFEPLS